MAQINKPSEYFNTVLYTGDGTTSQSITGVGFEPEFLWIKRRDSSANHRLTDVVRGVSNKLESSTTGAEAGSGIGSFDSDGWTFNATGAGFNASSATYVGWNWLAGGTASSNTDGSITSTVSANTTSGFSICTFDLTSEGSNQVTVGHGLGQAPNVVIVKPRSGTGNWTTYHSSLGNTKRVNLNETAAAATYSQAWGDTTPTSSVFTLGQASFHQNKTQVAYCFAEKKGFSKFGSYTGNGNADGTFIYTGFKPAWVMVKKYDDTSSAHWMIKDSARDPTNVNTNYLDANQTNADATGVLTDFLSNGFKQRSTNNISNDSGQNYIYMAFAEQPLVGTNNIPTTAR